MLLRASSTASPTYLYHTTVLRRGGILYRARGKAHRTTQIAGHASQCRRIMRHASCMYFMRIMHVGLRPASIMHAHHACILKKIPPMGVAGMQKNTPYGGLSVRKNTPYGALFLAQITPINTQLCVFWMYRSKSEIY